MSESMLAPVVLTLLTAFVMFATWWQDARAERMLERWCRHTGFDLLSRRNCWLWKGPYFTAFLNGQWVYRVQIRNRSGRVKSGYVRCGSHLLGVLAEEVDVRWDA